MTEQFVNGYGRVIEIRWKPYRERALGWTNRIVVARQAYWVRQHRRAKYLPKRLK